MNKHKITKKEFESIYKQNITLRTYNKIISKIDERFQEIVLTLLPGVTKRGWFDYGNCGYDGDETPGFFDKEEYKKDIAIGSEFASLPEPYGYSFPARWLWEDFEEEFASSVAKEKSSVELKKLDVKQKRDALKLKKEIIWESVKQKLTKEELKYVCLT